MCGRYTLSTPGEEIAEVFGLEESVELEPRFNIAPTQESAIVRSTGDDGRELILARWGLVPYWASDPSIGSRMINARSESVGEKRAYRDSFERRRCLVVADGFYEWKREGRHKQPFYFSEPAARPFAIAGIWDRWRGDGEELISYSLLTTDANAEVAEVHHRMPVILGPTSWSAWLGDAPGEALQDLLVPAADDFLARRPVSTVVNSPANDSPRCIEAIDLAQQSGTQPGLFDL